MLRMFQLFGRSAAIAALDDALRSAGVHPLLVPEAVKLTILKLHRQHPEGNDALSAALIGYCMLGHEGFAESTSAHAAAAADERVEAALEAGDTLDAKLVLLTLHAELIAPEIADRIDLDDSRPK